MLFIFCLIKKKNKKKGNKNYTKSICDSIKLFNKKYKNLYKENYFIEMKQNIKDFQGKTSLFSPKSTFINKELHFQYKN